MNSQVQEICVLRLSWRRVRYKTCNFTRSGQSQKAQVARSLRHQVQWCLRSGEFGFWGIYFFRSFVWV